MVYFSFVGASAWLVVLFQEQGFTMLVLKKNLRVSERFPYPVRIEAIFELIDQFPMRKLEKMTRKGSNLRFRYIIMSFNVLIENWQRVLQVHSVLSDKMLFDVVFLFRCKTTKKKVMVTRKRMKKKMVLSPQRRGNVTSVVALQRKPSLDKKAALRSKIQDILSGRSRFVIRKVPAGGSTRGKDSSSSGRTTSNGQEKVHSPPHVSKSSEEVKKDRCCLHI